MWALIVDNEVKEITGEDPTEKYHSSLKWVVADSSVQIGMQYVNGNFSKKIISKAGLEIIERLWRDDELKRADYELNKVQDADPKARGSVADWRGYRKALRSLPEHPNFTDISARPNPPDLI